MNEFCPPDRKRWCHVFAFNEMRVAAEQVSELKAFTTSTLFIGTPEVPRGARLLPHVRVELAFKSDGWYLGHYPEAIGLLATEDIGYRIDELKPQIRMTLKTDAASAAFFEQTFMLPLCQRNDSPHAI
jgi:hypothetical protein